MSVTTWLRKRVTRTARRSVAEATLRPRLEVLESRSLPSFGFAAGVPAGNAVATDAAGNAYVTGGNSVAKYSQLGAVQWAVSLGNATTSDTGIAVDAAGGISVVGYYTGTASFGSTVLTSPGGTDAFAAKLDGATGAVTWARNGFTVAGKTIMSSSLRVAADTAGNVYVADTLREASGYSWNAAIFKLDGGTGTIQWTDQLLSVTTGHGNNSYSGYTESPKLTVVGGNVYVTGYFTATVDFDPGPGTHTLASNGLDNGFVVKLTSGGAFVWADAFMGGGSQAGRCYPRGIAVDASGNVYTCSTLNGSIDFDPAPDGKRGAGQLFLSSANGAAVITKLNASGNLVWAKQFGVGAESVGLAVDAAGAVYVTGSFSGTADFNPSTSVYNLTSTGGTDVFVSKLDTNGAFQWAVRAGSTGDDSGSAIAVDTFGNIYISGSIGNGMCDFDLTQSYFDNRDLLTGPGGFLWQLMQP